MSFSASSSVPRELFSEKENLFKSFLRASHPPSGTIRPKHFPKESPGQNFERYQNQCVAATRASTRRPGEALKRNLAMTSCMLSNCIYTTEVSLISQARSRQRHASNKEWDSYHDKGTQEKFEIDFVKTFPMRMPLTPRPSTRSPSRSPNTRPAVIGRPFSTSSGAPNGEEPP